MSAIASKISQIRCCQFLEDTDRFLQNRLACVFPEGIDGAEIDLAVELGFQVAAEAKEIEEAATFGKFDDQVDVAVQAGFVAGDRTEEGERSHPQTFQGGAIALQGGDRELAAKGAIAALPPG